VVERDPRVVASDVLFERALFERDRGALTAADRLLDAAEADLLVARGRILHGRFLERRGTDPATAIEDPDELRAFDRAIQLYEALADAGGLAVATFWRGCAIQVVRGDDDAAVPVLAQALELATTAGDRVTMAESLRHLGIAAQRAGELDTAREHLEASTALRREDGALAGVASNLVGLIYIAVAEGRRDDARALVDEARAIAAACGATGVLVHIEDASASI
jgi:tetratricopeptide (TPR) repeat protein